MLKHRALDVLEVGVAVVPEVVDGLVVHDVPGQVPVALGGVLALAAHPVVAADLGDVPAAREAARQDAAVVGHVAVHVGAAVEGDDAGQVRRGQGGGHPLRPGVVGLADHAHLAGGPGLRGRPLDDVVVVPALGHAVPLPLALHRLAAAADVVVDVDVAALDEPLDLVGLAHVEGGDGRQVVEVLLVGRRGVEHGELALGVGPVDVHGHVHAVAHLDEDVLLHLDLVLRLAQLVDGEALGDHRCHDLGDEDLGEHAVSLFADGEPAARTLVGQGVGGENMPATAPPVSTR